MNQDHIDNGYIDLSLEDFNPAHGIKGIFDTRLAELKIDKAFATNIHRYVEEFKHRSDDHINFFGSNLTGTYPVRFVPVDKREWLIDILDIDELDTRRDVIKLPSVKETWVRGTDVMNLSCLYLVHRIMSNKALGNKEKYDMAKNVLLALHFKLIGSLMSHYFKFPVDERLAQTTYARLSKKYSIKQYGSWYRVLEARCDDVLSNNSIHKRTIERFDDDAAIQNMITDVQGRLKAMIKKIWEVLETVRNTDSKLMSTSGSIELDGKRVMRDLQRKDTPYIRYIAEIAPDDVRFIKRELIEVIGSVMQTMPEDFLVDALRYVSGKAKRSDPLVVELNKEVLLHAFDYFGKNQSTANSLTSDLGSLLLKFRALYMASRSKEPRLLKMRDDAELIVKNSIKSKNATVIASVRTGLLLYVLLRAFTMNHYETSSGDNSRVS